MAKQEMIDALVGTTIGNYIVQRKVGSGAMGSVYLGEHPEIGKRVAIKVLAGHLTEDAHMVERFQIEARAIGLLEHPNIVEMYDFGVLPDGRSYYTMEYLQGETLSQRMKRGNFKLRELYFIVEQICDALYVVHEKGIIHRDMKPSNVFLARKGMRTVVKLLDFGIAKIQDSMRKDGELLTSTGAVLGTPVFMSPEQALGQNDRISYLSDIYSVGVILYKIFTDRFPIEGTNIPEVVTWHLTRDAIPLRTANPLIPESLAQVVMTCLAKEPEGRYESTAHLWEAFSAACATLDMDWVIPSSIARDATISPAAGFSAGTGSHVSVVPSDSFYPPPPPPANNSLASHPSLPSYPQFATYPPMPPDAASSQSVVAGDSFAGERRRKSGGKFLFFSILAVVAVATGVFFWWKGSLGTDKEMTAPATAATSEPPVQDKKDETASKLVDMAEPPPEKQAPKTYRLRLDVKPAQAQIKVYVNGTLRDKVEPGASIEAEEGALVRISAQAEGFMPREREFIVNEKLGNDLTLELESLPAMRPAADSETRPSSPVMRPVPGMKGTDSNDKPKDLL